MRGGASAEEEEVIEDPFVDFDLAPRSHRIERDTWADAAKEKAAEIRSGSLKLPAPPVQL